MFLCRWAVGPAFISRHFARFRYLSARATATTVSPSIPIPELQLLQSQPRNAPVL